MNRQLNILLVEDNEGDIILTLEALKEANFTNGVEVVKDGQAALDYLNKRGEYAEVQTPDLVLLDINLPKLNGKEVLVEIKSSAELRMIPVIMLTTSDAQTDILESYTQYANCYITKPADFMDYADVVAQIKNFWMSIVRLPKSAYYDERA